MAGLVPPRVVNGEIMLGEKIVLDDRLRHIAIIMDGNGRWAQKRGLPREIGHSYGAETFRKITDYCREIGLKVLTVYAFSTENWKRPKKEVDSIIKLLSKYISEFEKSSEKYDLSVRFIGDISVFESSLRERIKKLEEKSKNNSLLLNIAFNYGGRNEIIYAANKLVAQGKEITEETLSAEIYTAHCSDPDLIIRTGGDLRISNFLLWQSAYAELYFTDVLWPDFGKEELNKAIESFYSRKRRYGGLDKTEKASK